MIRDFRDQEPTDLIFSQLRMNPSEYKHLMLSGENIDIYKSQLRGVETCHNQRQINSVIVFLLLLPSAELSLFCLGAPLYSTLRLPRYCSQLVQLPS